MIEWHVWSQIYKFDLLYGYIIIYQNEELVFIMFLPVNQWIRDPGAFFLYLFTVSKILTTWTNIWTNYAATGAMKLDITNEFENANYKKFSHDLLYPWRYK
jgi:hypothetical protein